MLRLLRTNPVVQQALDDAQAKLRSGALRDLARAGLDRPLPLEQKQRTIASATKGMATQQRLSAQARIERARNLGFRSVKAYLEHRYVGEGWTLTAVAAELHVGQSVLARLMGEAGIASRDNRRPWSVQENHRLLAMFDRHMTDAYTPIRTSFRCRIVRGLSRD